MNSENQTYTIVCITVLIFMCIAIYFAVEEKNQTQQNCITAMKINPNIQCFK